jgi:hypothetical protein
MQFAEFETACYPPLLVAESIRRPGGYREYPGGVVAVRRKAVGYEDYRPFPHLFALFQVAKLHDPNLVLWLHRPSIYGAKNELRGVSCPAIRRFAIEIVRGKLE